MFNLDFSVLLFEVVTIDLHYMTEDKNGST